jgi:serine protein kinase
MKWLEEVNKEQDHSKEIFSFDEYMKMVESHPRREARISCQYLKDMFDYFGKDDKGGFKLFSIDNHECPPVYGQIKTQQEIYQNLINFTEEGFNNKFLLLVGPNGSAKSSLIKKMMMAAENYSETDEGALYSYSWIFPIDTYIKGSLGLSSKATEKLTTTFAHLEDKDISAILPSELKDHPLLLIPKPARQKLLDNLLSKFPDQLETIKLSYLYHGDMSKRNRMIFDALLQNYKGSYTDVYKHIRVERFTINRRYSSAAVTVEPQLHVDARLQQITMDRRLNSLPPSLQSLNLFSLNGEVVMANRGMIEFSDLLKRPLDAFKYLLMTMESRNVNLQGIITELDIFFVGSSNEIHLSAFKQHPDFNSFKGRFNFLKVPYLLNAKDETNIYNEQIHVLKGKCVFEPHALETFCYFASMTRLRCPQVKNFLDEKLGKIASNLNPLEKTLLLSVEQIPDYLSSESKQILKLGINDIYHEYENDNLYEGKFGISPREMKQLIYEIASKYNHVSFVQAIEFLEEFIERKNEYDFLNIAAQGDFHHPRRFLDLLDEYQLDFFDNEVRDSLGLVDARSYEDYIAKYILHISSLIKGEKIKNSVTGKFEVSDMFFINEFETSIALREKPEDFRSHMISMLGAYSLDNPGKPIKYTVVFAEIVKALQESFRSEQKKTIDKIAKNLVYFISEKEMKKSKNVANHQKTPLTKDAREDIEKVINNLKNKYHYTDEGALSLLQYLIKKRY